MSYRKQLFGLDEVGVELECMGIKRWHLILLSDLQQDTLAAVVKFPNYRDAYTRVPSSIWHETDVVRLFKRPGRRGWREELDYALSVNDFFAPEEDLLRLTIQAASLRDHASIPAEFRQRMEKCGLLKTDMSAEDWRTALVWLFDCWKQLSDLDGRTVLHPMVKADEMQRYLRAVEADRMSPRKDLVRPHPGGRTESPHWPAIDKTIIRELAKRAAILQDGDVQKFAQHVHVLVKKKVSEDRWPVPRVDTIAQKLRRILKPNGDE